MRLFTLIDFRHLVLAFFLGASAALVIYLSFRYPGKRSRGTGETEEERTAIPEEEYPDGLRIGANPVPPVLVYLFVGFVLWFICYVIFFGILGNPV